jgi:hypothetical protein
MDDLAGEVRGLRMELRQEMRDLRTELKDELRELRIELYSTRRWTVNLWATTVVGFVALLIQTSLR